MKLQRMVWVVDRVMVYTVLLILAILLVVALVYQSGPGTVIVGIAFLFALHKGLVRMKIGGNSVIVSNGRVVFFVPGTIIRNRFDFVSRGQKVVELPEYQLLDRTFDIDLFVARVDGRVQCCRLSLWLGYLMEPAAWQHAYDSFVTHAERLPLEVKKLLLAACGKLDLQPPTGTGDDTVREYLAPVIFRLNGALASVGMEVVEVQCCLADGQILPRLVAGDQQEVESGPIGAMFKWQVKVDEGPLAGPGEMIEVPKEKREA